MKLLKFTGKFKRLWFFILRPDILWKKGTLLKLTKQFFPTNKLSTKLVFDIEGGWGTYWIIIWIPIGFDTNLAWDIHYKLMDRYICSNYYHPELGTKLEFYYDH